MEQQPAPEARARAAGRIFAKIVALFFVSGFCGLVYETLWMRELALVFGNTTHAASAVVTAFMAGLAAGSAWFGRRVDRDPANALALYGRMEIGVAALAVASPLLFHAVRAANALLYPLDPPFLALQLARFALSALALLPATFLMGGTLPVISRAIEARLPEASANIGLVYGVNTVGAVAGTLAAIYLLLPTQGMQTSLLLTALLNFGVGVVALLVHAESAALGLGPAPAEAAPAAPAGPPRAALALFAAAGFASMAAEVAWVRLLTPITGSSVYAFGIMLSTFLLGIAAGSLVYAALARRGADDLAVFGLAECGVALCAALLLPLFPLLPFLFVGMQGALGGSFLSMQAIVFALAALTMLPPTLFMGVAFPAGAAARAREAAARGEGIGLAYASNTVGCITGSFLAGFLLIPHLGARTTLLLAAATALAAGLAALPRTALRPRLAAIGLPAATLFALAAAISLSGWNVNLQTIGMVEADSIIRELGFARYEEHFELLHFREGLDSTLSVHRSRDDGQINLKVNGRTNASTNALDMYTQLILAYLPLFHRPEAREVLVIGFASGITVAAAAAMPVQRIDCVEIEASQRDTARFFAAQNRDVLADPRVRFIVGDGRNHVQMTDRRYDVIISEPSHVWVAGVASLFTREHFAACRDRLTDDGVICQWIQLYQMQPEDVKTVVKTFREVFPRTTVWFSVREDMLLIGQKGGAALDLPAVDRILRENPRVAADLAPHRVTSAAGLLGSFLLGERSAAALGEDAAFIHTDDFPILEFRAPANAFAQTGINNFQGICRYRDGDAPEGTRFPEGGTASVEFLVAVGDAYLQKKAAALAMSFYERAFAVAGSAEASVAERIGDLYLASGKPGEAEPWYERVLASEPGRASALLNRARAAAGCGRDTAATRLFRDALARAPEDRAIAHAAADHFFARQRYSDALPLYERLAKAPDADATVRYRLGFCRLRNGDPVGAEAPLAAAAADPAARSAERAAAHIAAAEAWRDRKEWRRAIADYDAALALAPGDAAAHYNRGLCRLELREFEPALEDFRTALDRDPYLAEAQRSIALLTGGDEAGARRP